MAKGHIFDRFLKLLQVSFLSLPLTYASQKAKVQVIVAFTFNMLTPVTLILLWLFTHFSPFHSSCAYSLLHLLSHMSPTIHSKWESTMKSMWFLFQSNFFFMDSRKYYARPQFYSQKDYYFLVYFAFFAFSHLFTYFTSPNSFFNLKRFDCFRSFMPFLYVSISDHLLKEKCLAK